MPKTIITKIFKQGVRLTSFTQRGDIQIEFMLEDQDADTVVITEDRFILDLILCGDVAISPVPQVPPKAEVELAATKQIAVTLLESMDTEQVIRLLVESNQLDAIRAIKMVLDLCQRTEDYYISLGNIYDEAQAKLFARRLTNEYGLTGGYGSYAGNYSLTVCVSKEYAVNKGDAIGRIMHTMAQLV